MYILDSKYNYINRIITWTNSHGYICIYDYKIQICICDHSSVFYIAWNFEKINFDSLLKWEPERFWIFGKRIQNLFI